ncbi:hypothetical protein SKAU_G00163250 [Synaphobranchus kaupii]|uniref:Uncharacterized protein n=1 Tax=Synaphobranchus kaupii TaxID=118154 RepID=A0A9Q1FIX7_SYNKA|nr:hypothetical protein SKAU_G00163250 [Synaphobranchus kaupii]
MQLLQEEEEEEKLAWPEDPPASITEAGHKEDRLSPPMTSDIQPNSQNTPITVRHPIPAKYPHNTPITQS